MANGVQAGKQGHKPGQNGALGAGHTIIVTPVTSPETKSLNNGNNGLNNLQTQPKAENGANKGALSIKQNIRYAVNYRSAENILFKEHFVCFTECVILLTSGPWRAAAAPPQQRPWRAATTAAGRRWVSK